MRKLFVVLFGLAVFFLVSVPTFAATDNQTVENGFYKVVMHKYEGAQTSIEEITNFEPGPNLQYVSWQLFAEWPVSVDIYLKPLSSWFNDPNSTLSGYLMIPIYYDFYANSLIFSDMNNIDSAFHIPWSALIYQDRNLFPEFSNSGNITFNYFSRGGTYWLGLMLDSVPVASLRQNDDSYRISANFIFKGSFIYQATQCYIVADDVYRLRYSPLMNLSMTTGISSTWVSNLSLDTPLSTMIANGINNSTDIDSILSYLYAIRGSTTTIAEVVPYVQNIDSVMTSLYNYVTSNSNQYYSLLHNLEIYASSCSVNLTNLYALLSTGQLADDISDQLTELTTIRTDLATFSWLFRLFFNSYTFDYNDPYKNRMASGWVNIIKTALSDFDVSIQLDQDTNVNIEVTNNDVKNIYNNQQTVNNFEADIIFDFQSYIQDVPFSMIDPQNGPTGLVQATAAGKGWIESVFNAMGPYNYLVVITLLVGLVAGLIGPINRFIVSRFK